jgi:DNA-binding NtrC family response regulator
MSTTKTLLAIIELGGYPDFSSLYRASGYDVVVENSMRKALNYLKRHEPAIIVAEFNYQSSFRDRLSSLESLIAVVQRKPNIKIIVFYEKEYEHQFKRLQAQYAFFDAIVFPIDRRRLEESLQRAAN